MAGTYKCGTTGCYSYQSPETNVLFQRLQVLINQFSAIGGFQPIRVDGIIGKGTTEAALLVLIALYEADAGAIGQKARTIEAAITGPESLAQLAQPVVDTLSAALTQAPAVASQLLPAGPMPAPTAKPPTTVVATSTANAPITTTSQAAQLKLTALKTARPALATSLLDRIPPWAAYASGAALVLGGIAVAIVGKRRKGATAVAGW
jgi:hypothetical protein